MGNSNSRIQKLTEEIIKDRKFHNDHYESERILNKFEYYINHENGEVEVELKDFIKILKEKYENKDEKSQIKDGIIKVEGTRGRRETYNYDLNIRGDWCHFGDKSERYDNKSPLSYNNNRNISRINFSFFKNKLFCYGNRFMNYSMIFYNSFLIKRYQPYSIILGTFNFVNDFDRFVLIMNKGGCVIFKTIKDNLYEIHYGDKIYTITNNKELRYIKKDKKYERNHLELKSITKDNQHIRNYFISFEDTCRIVGAKIPFFWTKNYFHVYKQMYKNKLFDTNVFKIIIEYV